MSESFTAYFPPESNGCPTADNRQPPFEIKQTTERLAVAMQFVGLCNHHWGPRGVHKSDMDGCESAVVVMDMPPSQDACFRVCCKFIGDFVSGKHPGQPNYQEEYDDFNDECDDGDDDVGDTEVEQPTGESGGESHVE